MNLNKLIAGSVMSAVISAGVSVQAIAKPPEMEKCAGIVKAGKNDCGSGSNACAGQDKVNNSADAWIYLPKGSCDKIVGGHVLKGNNQSTKTS